MLTRLRNTPAAERVARRLCRGGRDRRRGRGTERGDRPARAAADRGGGARSPAGAVNVLTHCNAGWLATVDWGTALAPIYMAHDAGIDVHVWVDETRPRNQGAALTAWELGRHGVAHTVIADNAGGHLMQHGEVDLVIVGTDRVTRDRRRRQQDRHLSEGAGGARQRRAVLGGAAVHDDRLDRVATAWREIPIEERARAEVTDMTGRTAGRHDRHGARRAGRQRGRQSGVRRDAGAAGQRADHRARPLRCERSGSCRIVPGTGMNGRGLLFPDSKRRAVTDVEQHPKAAERDAEAPCTVMDRVLGVVLASGCAQTGPHGGPGRRRSRSSVRARPGRTGRACPRFRDPGLRAIQPHRRDRHRAARMAAVRLAGRRRRSGTAARSSTAVEKPERQPGCGSGSANTGGSARIQAIRELDWTGKHDGNGAESSTSSQDGIYAWSAIFISYVMRIAGAGRRFPYSRQPFATISMQARSGQARRLGHERAGSGSSMRRSRAT